MLYKHSVRIDRRKCVGCTNCIKNCPTEAIRVQRGKAKILDDRCIDCGQCLISCPHHAMVSVTTPLAAEREFKYNIIIPCTALYSQFRSLSDLGDIYEALYAMGFDYIYDEARAAEITAEAMRKYLRSGEAPSPVISCSCPVIPRLVTTLFPNLIDNLSPFLSPTEVAARIAKEEFCNMMGVPKETVGAYYIAPCAAKMTHIKNPLGVTKSEINGVYSMKEIYAELIKRVGKQETAGELRSTAFPPNAYGLGTAVVGGFSAAVGTEHYLAVDGINNVMQCLDEIDNERLRNLMLVEVWACSGGCVGGPLMFENQFVAKNRNRRIANSRPRTDLERDEHILKYVESPLIRYDQHFEPQSVMKLSDDMTEAMRMMDKMEEISASLPGLDCGSCGSPSCRTLAEDIVRGQAVEMDCIFKLRDKLRIMAQEMTDLASAEKRG
ncbi:MAG: [Fe-Fe] hydrogenase large subunit C-terminal domain-containing protein [Eubacteriales bacterium]|nr:[Fe-Fe] hydrogenase large subunit C-terminal domain-containing protein [Eubacteriales bacterium]